MRIGRARALLLATAAVVSCGKSGGAGGTTGDAGLQGPTNLVVSWTIAGKPADDAICKMYGSAQIYLNLSGTLDPSVHQDTTLDCGAGTYTFMQLLVEKLGDNAYLEGTLLDGSATQVAIAGVTVMPALPTTNVTLAFFGPQGSGGMGGMMTTSSTSQSQAASSTSGAGGTGGTGGVSSASSTAAATSSTAASTSSSSGIVDAGGGG